MTGRTGVGTPRTTPRASSSSPQSGPDLRIIHQGQRPFGRPKAGHTSAVRTEHAVLRRENPCRAGTVHTRRCSGAPNPGASAGPCRPPAPPPRARTPPAPAPGRASAAPPARPGTAPPRAAARRRPARGGGSRSSSAPSRVGVQPPINRGGRHEAPGATTRQEFRPLVLPERFRRARSARGLPDLLTSLSTQAYESAAALLINPL